MSFNPSLLGQGFLEGEREKEREPLPGYKIKTENVRITIFSPGAAVVDKIQPWREATFTVFSAVNRYLSIS